MRETILDIKWQECKYSLFLTTKCQSYLTKHLMSGNYRLNMIWKQPKACCKAGGLFMCVLLSFKY